VLSGVERLLVEFIRRNREVLAGLTAPQLESIVLAALGAAALALLVRRRGLDGLRVTGRPAPRAA
jgi:hypothetical protein